MYIYKIYIYIYNIYIYIVYHIFYFINIDEIFIFINFIQVNFFKYVKDPILHRNIMFNWFSFSVFNFYKDINSKYLLLNIFNFNNIMYIYLFRKLIYGNLMYLIHYLRLFFDGERNRGLRFILSNIFLSDKIYKYKLNIFQKLNIFLKFLIYCINFCFINFIYYIILYLTYLIYSFFNFIFKFKYLIISYCFLLICFKYY